MNHGVCPTRSLDRYWRHHGDGPVGRPASAVWSAIIESLAPRPLDRSPSPRALEARQHRESNASARRIVDRMGRALLDRYPLLGPFAVDVRFGVGAITFFGPRAVDWHQHGSGATAYFATGDGSRNRFLEDANAGVQLHQEPGHTHGLRRRYVPRRARDGFAGSLRQM